MQDFVNQAIEKGLAAIIIGIVLPVAFCLWLLAYTALTHPERTGFSVYYLRAVALADIAKDALSRLRLIGKNSRP